MIETFANDLAEDLFHDRRSKTVRQLPGTLVAAARRKLLYLHDAEGLDDLRALPGNRLKALRGNTPACFDERRQYEEFRDLPVERRSADLQVRFTRRA